MSSPKKLKKQLLRRKDELLALYQKLEKDFENKSMDKSEFDERKNKIERELVEIMDRLTQLKFLM
jgi:hypothetical protein